MERAVALWLMGMRDFWATGTAPTLSTGANTVDGIDYVVTATLSTATFANFWRFFRNNALVRSGAGAGAAAAAEYVIPKSLRFNSGDSAYIFIESG